jgi:hypothetical protein
MGQFALSGNKEHGQDTHCKQEQRETRGGARGATVLGEAENAFSTASIETSEAKLCTTIMLSVLVSKTATLINLFKEKQRSISAFRSFLCLGRAGFAFARQAFGRSIRSLFFFRTCHARFGMAVREECLKMKGMEKALNLRAGLQLSERSFRVLLVYIQFRSRGCKQRPSPGPNTRKKGERKAKVQKQVAHRPRGLQK